MRTLEQGRRAAMFAVACFLSVGVSVCHAADDAAGVEFFEKRIRPVLVEHCYACHSARAKNVRSSFRLDSRQALLKGGDFGVDVVPGMPDESLLLAALKYTDPSLLMPPDGKLPERVIADFRKWIELGAPYPDGADDDAPVPQESIDIEQGRRHWAFQPVHELPVSKVEPNAWPKRKIDWFVLRRLLENGLQPAPEANRRTLARRVWLDVIGLPPTTEELRQFLNDTAPHAYERLVDRLLASPHYGERWGRHWLDVARYAEDNPTGESTCKPPPAPWPYRDWVIRALNADLRYDEFVRRQLAADLMQDLPPEEVAATGFLGLSPVYHKEPKLSKEVVSVIVADEWDERLDTVTRGFLGLTVACARCHDHKFDPIRTEDYYALAGVMASTQLVEWPLVDTSIVEADALTRTREAIVDTELRLSYANDMRETAELEGRPSELYAQRAAELKQQLEELKTRDLFGGPIANVVRDAGNWVNGEDPDWTFMQFQPGEPRDLPVFVRGNPNNPGETVRRRFLEVLSAGKPTPFQQGSGRLELAEAIVTEAAPLTARVIVNRVWGWHFGQALVATPSNFGKLGASPSHPELLDDLAARFISHGWSLKWLHREIVLSATYRQASTVTQTAAEDGVDPVQADPDNLLLWRMNRRRLEPEIWRDSVLQIAGRLNASMFGKSQSLDDDVNTRRSVYGTVSRQTPADILLLFDFPDAKWHTDRRMLTTTPLQQLYLLNSQFVQEQAAAVAHSVADDDEDRPAIAEALFQRILLRTPNADELRQALALVDAGATGDGTGRWQLLAHALLASNEFLFVD